jgi:hypothetical protein
MKTSRKYANPPVVEALCEVSFIEPHWDPDCPWSVLRERSTSGAGGRERERCAGVRACDARCGSPVDRVGLRYINEIDLSPTAAVSTEPKLRFRNVDCAPTISW